MASTWRAIFVGLCCAAAAGCTQFSDASGINRADPLGFPVDPVTLPKLPELPMAPLAPAQYSEQYRDQFVELWMARSDILCRQYKDKIIAVSRDTRLGTHATQTVLSGLATIFTSLSVIHPLTGAATIVGGVGAAADSDIFEKQGGEIIATAIQTARENQANQIEKNLSQDINNYNIYRAERDVAEYHNMCSLETGLSQIRSALRATSPDAGATPPAKQGDQANTVQAGATADATTKAAVGAAAGVAAAQAQGLSPTAGAALGAAAGAASSGSPTNAAAAGTDAVINAAPAPAPASQPRPRQSPVSISAPVPAPGPSPTMATVPPAFSTAQKAFIAAVRGLPHDPTKPAQLTTAARQTIDGCISPMPKGTSTTQILLNARAALPKITSCILGANR